MRNWLQVRRPALLRDLRQVRRIVGPLPEQRVTVDAVLAVPDVLARLDRWGQRLFVGQCRKLSVTVDGEHDEDQRKQRGPDDEKQACLPFRHAHLVTALRASHARWLVRSQAATRVPGPHSHVDAGEVGNPYPCCIDDCDEDDCENQEAERARERPAAHRWLDSHDTPPLPGSIRRANSGAVRLRGLLPECESCGCLLLKPDRDCNSQFRRVISRPYRDLPTSSRASPG